MFAISSCVSAMVNFISLSPQREARAHSSNNCANLPPAVVDRASRRASRKTAPYSSERDCAAFMLAVPWLCSRSTNCSRRTVLIVHGSIVSAVTSCGVSASAAFNPSRSPATAIFRIIVRPSREVVESFTCPLHRTKILRAASPSANSLAPGAWLTSTPIRSNSSNASCGRLQNRRTCRCSQ